VNQREPSAKEVNSPGVQIMSINLKQKPMLIIAWLSMLAALVGCSITPTLTSTPAPTPTPQDKQPVEILSVSGPLQPVNPGGPVVEIALKNGSTEPIVNLAAKLELSRTFVFNFDVTPSHPLLPENTISSKLTLIGGGFSDSLSYPLTINGTTQNGATFVYTKQVIIKQPPVPPANSAVAKPTFSPSPIEPSTSAPNTIEFGSRILTNNVWGAPPDESLTSGVYLNRDNSFGWYWNRIDPMLNPGHTLIQPIFPNVRIGGSPSAKSKSGIFPLKQADITSLKFDAAYNYLTLPTGAYNLAYEMFFSDTNQPSSNLVPKAEVMIWIHATFTQPPTTYVGDITDGFNTYHLYSWIRSDGRLYASFIMEGEPQFQAQHRVDARSLLDHLALDPDWYLLGVELGSEIVNGFGDIEISKFKVNMNGYEP
jgi:hypothetical protein